MIIFPEYAGILFKMKLSVSKMKSLPIKVDSVWTPGYKVFKTNISNESMLISKYIPFAGEERL